ncbi:MAG: hypothetical protein NPINA01_25550 [Nitrospinaceae bacterium]|nr:MAG: hypothetical protein NPINA01_25550 [Nitrospinaceae bacterium]
MMRKVVRQKLRVFTFLLTVFLILVSLVNEVFSVEPESMDLLAEKPPGICPQERNTPQAPEAFYKMTNPLEPTPDNLQAGKALFKIDARPTACKVCHGYGGDGMGIIFEQLIPRPRNFTCYYTMDEIPDGQIYWIIKKGSPGTKMPAFRDLSDKEVWQLVLFIRQFSKKTK